MIARLFTFPPLIRRQLSAVCETQHVENYAEGVHQFQPRVVATLGFQCFLLHTRTLKEFAQTPDNHSPTPQRYCSLVT